MDLNAHAAGLNFHFVKGEPLDYLFDLTDWAGDESIDLGTGRVYGIVQGVRGEEEEQEITMEDVPKSTMKLMTFPELEPGRYVYEVWVAWADGNRNRLIEGAVTMEASAMRWEELAKPPVGKRVVQVRVSAGQEGSIRAVVLSDGFVGAMALRAEAAAASADVSAAEAAASELVAKAAEAVAEKCRGIVEEAQAEVKKLEQSASAAEAAARGSATSAAGSAGSALGSEENARASAAAAAKSAQAAAASDSAAERSAGSAAASAQWASDSATSAGGSATDARDSATAAAKSEVSAAGSAAAAAKSEEAAAAKSEEAAGSEQAASMAAGRAAGSATSAAGSASRAEAAAGSVEGKAEAAAAAAKRAEAAAGSVEGKAEAAAASAAAAAKSEEAAAGSAERAQEAEGKASFELWQENGHPGGTVQEYLEDLRGKSAYEIWLAQGNVGTEDDFLKSLKGKDGLNTREEMDEVYAQIVNVNQQFADEAAARERAIEEHAEDRLLHPTKTRQAGWDNKLEEADVYTREGAELSSKPHMANDGAEVADAFGRYVGIGQADLVFQGECEAWELASLTIRCRDTAIGNVGDAAYYLGVYERVEGGSEGDFKWVGTSKDKVQQQLGEDSTWHFERTVIHRRNLRFILFAERDDPWPADGEGVQIGVRMAGKTGQSGQWTGVGGLSGGFENTYCPIVELKYYKLKSKYAGEALQGVVDGHVGDKTAHVTSTERAKWDKAAEHAGDTTVHVTASEKATWNGKVSTETLNNHTGDTTRHVTASEKATWNGKVSTETFNAHATNTTVHVTAGEKETWNGKADAGTLSSHTGDTTVHVTAGEKATWNGKVSTDTLNNHTGDTTRHVTASEKAAWNGKADADTLSSHTGDKTIHVTAGEKETWNGKADADTLSSHTGDTTIHVTAGEKSKWNGKVSSTVGKVTDIRYYKKGSEPTLSSRVSGVLYLVSES